MDSLLEIGWEGHVLGKYIIGIILLETESKTNVRHKNTHSSCLRSPFRCTSTLTQYSTSAENVDDHQAQEGGSGLVPPATWDGNGMTNGKHSSVGVNISRGGQEMTVADVSRFRWTCPEINPFSDEVTLTLPWSCEKKDHVRQRQLCCTWRMKRVNKAVSTETSTRTTWVHFLLSLMAPCTIPLNPYAGCLRPHMRLPRVTATRELSYRKVEVEDHSELLPSEY